VLGTAAAIGSCSLEVVGVKNGIGVFSVVIGTQRSSGAASCTKERIGTK
jgi:hypothetical protein